MRFEFGVLEMESMANGIGCVQKEPLLSVNDNEMGNVGTSSRSDLKSSRCDKMHCTLLAVREEEDGDDVVEGWLACRSTFWPGD